MAEIKDAIINTTSSSASWDAEMSSISTFLETIPSEASSDKGNQSQDSGITRSDLQIYIDLSIPSVLSPNPSDNDPTLNSSTNNTTHNSWLLSEFEHIKAPCNDSTVNINKLITKPKIDTISYEDKISETYLDHIQNSPVQNLYVKLSDLDKPISQFNFKYDSDRIIQSVPEKKRIFEQPSAGSVALFSSLQSKNASSLNRLFPNLIDSLSESMSGSISGRMKSLRSNISPSPAEIDNKCLKANINIMYINLQQNSLSTLDSISHSKNYAANLISNCPTRLGQDLLHMFLEEIASDVIVEVAGKRIKAHKCILSSRCQYFARILSGGFVESAGNVIVLPSGSFEVIHFVLCYIYSGTFQILDRIPIIELAATTDMFCLEGLKDVIMDKLESSDCHNFHTPCAICIVGVVECFSLSSMYELDDLYLNCLKWITKHFTKVWVTEAFLALPKELLERCYTEHEVNLCLDNFIDTVYGCGIVVGTLEKTRGANKVIKMCQRLLKSAAHFAGTKLVKVLKLLDTTHNNLDPFAKQRLIECVTAAIQWSPPQETCRTYAFLSNYIKETRHQNDKPELILNIKQKSSHSSNLLYTNVSSWRRQCENTLVRATPSVVNTEEYKNLPLNLRARLSELGCIVLEVPPSSQSIRSEKMKSSAQTKRVKNPAYLEMMRNFYIEKIKKSFIPYQLKPIIINPKLNSDREKKNTPPIIRTTKAHNERTMFNLSKANAEAIKPVLGVTKSANLKPGGLRDAKSKTSQNKSISRMKSSRDIPPVRPLPMKSNQTKVISQESLSRLSRPRTAEPTTNLLSESRSNKYDTYTKAKKTLRGSSVESIRTQKALASSSKILKSKIPCLIQKQDNAIKTRQLQNHITPTMKSIKSELNQSKQTRSLISTTQKQVPKPRTKINSTLYSATKSSAAKIVTKIEKDPLKNRS